VLIFVSRELKKEKGDQKKSQTGGRKGRKKLGEGASRNSPGLKKGRVRKLKTPEVLHKAIKSKSGEIMSGLQIDRIATGHPSTLSKSSMERSGEDRKRGREKSKTRSTLKNVQRNYKEGVTQWRPTKMKAKALIAEG